jgi:hypothetical protein
MAQNASAAPFEARHPKSAVADLDLKKPMSGKPDIGGGRLRVTAPEREAHACAMNFLFM